MAAFWLQGGKGLAAISGIFCRLFAALPPAGGAKLRIHDGARKAADPQMNTTRNPPAAPQAATQPDAAELARAFALFSKASEELSTVYSALQDQVMQLTERLSVLMAALPAGVIVLGRDGHVVQANRAAEAMFGARLEQQAWAQLAQALVETESPGEFMCTGQPEPRRLSLSASELESGEGRILLLHDVTESNAMRLAAERNERLAAMGEMVAGLAHQLRTPLSAALLYTSTLGQPELPAADRGRVAERAVERLRHLERLIRDMLLFARGDRLEPQRFDVCELLAELRHTLDPVARAGQVRFDSECRCAGQLLSGDRKALAGALTNLLENAVQAAGPGGRVTLTAERTGDTVRFEVADDGGGIDQTLQARLFEPFFTTRAEGTGLGLAIARGVARAHGGEIALESASGQGACFTLTLPLHPGDAARSNGTDQP
jgi:two-component system sensor histidine kinase FlrB